MDGAGEEIEHKEQEVPGSEYEKTTGRSQKNCSPGKLSWRSSVRVCWGKTGNLERDACDMQERGEGVGGSSKEVTCKYNGRNRALQQTALRFCPYGAQYYGSQPRRKVKGKEVKKRLRKYVVTELQPVLAVVCLTGFSRTCIVPRSEAAPPDAEIQEG